VTGRIRDSSVAGAASKVVRKSRVGARLVEDSSMAASNVWSSESSTFFIRELGPRTRARPETGQQCRLVCLSPGVSL
jgi:hypothetical protein